MHFHELHVYKGTVKTKKKSDKKTFWLNVNNIRSDFCLSVYWFTILFKPETRTVF